MKNKIIEAAELPEEDKVYLKKDLFGWRTIEPWKDPANDRINWFNFLLGGKRNLATLAFVLIIIGLLALGFNEVVSGMRDIVAQPCNYCQGYSQSSAGGSLAGLNLSGINISYGGQN